MQSNKTEQVIELTKPEAESVEKKLKAGNVQFEVVDVKLTPESAPLRTIRMPHQNFIVERNRIARERERALVKQQRDERKREGRKSGSPR